MKLEKQGLSIDIEKVKNNFFLSLKAKGKLTHKDYQTITPMIDLALVGVDSPKIKVLVDAGELERWEARAAWDDFKLGLKHGKGFEKIAILGNKDWQKLVAKVGDWLCQERLNILIIKKIALIG